jgi:uncharacterized protein YegL
LPEDIQEELKHQMEEDIDMDSGEDMGAKASDDSQQEFSEQPESTPEDSSGQSFDDLPDQTQEDLKQQVEEDLQSMSQEQRQEFQNSLKQQHQKRKKHERQERRERRREQLQETTERIESEFEDRKTEYDEAYEEVSDDITRVAEDIMDILLEEHAESYETKFPGQKLRLEGARKYEAKSDYTELFATRLENEKNEYNVTLLVDLSGSMKDDKIEETFKGAVMFVEALSQVAEIIPDFDVGVYGFQDVLLEYKSTDEEIDDTLREKMSVMKKEPYGDGDNNRTNVTNLGYCLNGVFEKRNKDSDVKNFFFVISDGAPPVVGSPSVEGFSDTDEDVDEELHHVVEKISDEEDVFAFALGLGPDTEHVEDFFSSDLENVENVANITSDELANVLSEKLRRLLT